MSALPIIVPKTAKAADRPPMKHYQHPERPGESWCGAPVIGCLTDGPLDCVVCADLRAAQRRKAA